MLTERWLAGSGFPGQAAEEIQTALPLLLGATPAVFPATMPRQGERGCHEGAAWPEPHHQLQPVPRCPRPCPLSADAHPLSSSIMNSTPSASSATCRVSRKRDLPPPLPRSPSARALRAWGVGLSKPGLGLPGSPCPQLNAKPRLGQGESSSWSSGPWGVLARGSRSLSCISLPCSVQGHVTHPGSERYAVAKTLCRAASCPRAQR